jgi:acetyl/propionyl-CoA carboxylase alpha subunit
MDTPRCTELYTALDTDAFDSVLIANRGEIAARIVRSAQALGLRAVAVYSNADAATPHTSHADEAIHLTGPNPYLDVELIVEAAVRTGAGARHPRQSGDL